MRPHYTAPTDAPRTSGGASGGENGVTSRTPSRASAERPRSIRRLPARTVTGCVLAAGVAALALAAPAVAPTAGSSAVRLSKPDAHRVAVRATADTCGAVAWCKGYDVVSAKRCRRDNAKTVYCAIAFITAQRQRCGGVVGVSRTRGGRLDKVMAVPQNCSADQPPDGDRPPTTND
jgi:hypothetical protein